MNSEFFYRLKFKNCPQNAVYFVLKLSMSVGRITENFCDVPWYAHEWFQLLVSIPVKLHRWKM